MADDPNQQAGGGVSEVISQLQNIARNLALWSQSQVNVYPITTTTASPKFTGVTLSTTATVAIASSTLRHGILFQNVGVTANIYLYQTGMTSPPTTSALAGSIVIYPGETFALPSATFPNVTAGFSAFANTGSSQPFTIVEFF